MNYLTYNQIVDKDLLKFLDGTGSQDYVIFFQMSSVTDLMFVENKALGYMGLTIIEDNKAVEEFFFQSESDFEMFKEHYDFNWNMSPEDKANIILNWHHATI